MFTFNSLYKIGVTAFLLIPTLILVTSENTNGNLALPIEVQSNLISQNQREQKERRVALIIGNSQYQKSPLTNPVNDATDMAEVLGELGFEVIKLLDADLKTMSEGVNKFQQKLGPGVVGLFYYAGHGVQVDGENYLLPIDAMLTTKDTVTSETVGLNSILRQMQAAQTKMNIIILDACRNDPFKRSWGEEQTRSFSLGGLAPIDAKVGSLIAYSTAPGDYAADGYGRNSPYTEQLKKHIKTPNLDIEIMFRQVRAGVYQETRGNQIPWVSVSITDSFAFKTTQNQQEISNPILATSQTRENLPVIVAARAIHPREMYERLEHFLSNLEWQKADQQTWEIIRQLSSYGRKIGVSLGEIDNFSCPDLQKIDELWLKYSNNRFGLSVQENIYQSYGGNGDSDAFHDFATKIGWRRINRVNNRQEYLAYNELDFSLNAPMGHFPTTAGIDGLSTIARTWALYNTEYESFIKNLLERVAVCR